MVERNIWSARSSIQAVVPDNEFILLILGFDILNFPLVPFWLFVGRGCECFDG